ncbi:MAG TPA: AraC family transcriptional regulator, partial [Hyphomonas sp.]|nr:AraC family transcriptional regulator [Hyphomonas sp.]
ESRAERAGLMLAQGTSVAQVAEFLGYSDVRAFNRAFKKMRGVSPAVYARSSMETAQA